jgi:hypothetical protein
VRSSSKNEVLDNFRQFPIACGFRLMPWLALSHVITVSTIGDQQQKTRVREALR